MGTLLYGRLLLPPDGAESGKIPLIINIYGGPAGQMVRKGVPDAFDEILARKGFAIFAVDNRGTPGRDRKFQTAIRHEFGAIELKNQLTALDQLLAQYPQLDPVKLSKVALGKLLRQLHMGNLGSVERFSVVVIFISASYPFII